MARGWISAAFIIGACASCRSDEVTRVELAGRGIDYAFITILDEQGEPKRVTPFFGIEDGGISFGDAVLKDLSADESTSVIVGLSRDELLRLLPAFDVDRQTELTAELSPAPFETTSVEGQPPEATLLSMELPDSTRFLTAELTGTGSDPAALTESSSENVRKAITLKVPVDPEYCRIEGQSPLLAFGQRKTSLYRFMDGNKQAEDILRVVRVDRDRVLVLAPDFVYVIYRGQPLEMSMATADVPGDIFNPDLYPGPEEYARVSDMAIDRPPRADGTLRVLAVGQTDNEGARGRIWELELGPEGLKPLAAITTAQGLYAVSIDPQGTGVILGSGGRSFTLARGSNTVDALPPFSPIAAMEGQVRRVSWMDDPTDAIIATTEGQIHVFDRRLNVWATSTIPTALLSADQVVGAQVGAIQFDGIAAIPTPNGLEIWAAGSHGALFRKVGSGDWTLQRLVPPPRFAPCNQRVTTYPNLTMSLHIDDMIADGDYLHMTIRECTAILQVRRSDLCVSMLETEDGAPMTSASKDLQALDLFEGRLTVGGEIGLLFERP